VWKRSAPHETEEPMTGSVVTGIDGSDTAREAASKAAELAATRGVELVVVCAYDKLEVTELNEDGRQYVFTTEESAQTSAQAAISDFQKQYPGLAGRPAC
jgi:nucleotide-binding universal stress UspA family protein